MSGPWEKYQKPAADEDGPWTRYRAAASGAATEPAQPSELSKEQRSTIQEIGRQLGLTLRAGAQGAVTLPAMLSDAVTGVLNEGLDAALGEGQGFRFQKAQAALGKVMSAAGVPEPEGATERVVQDVGSAMTGAGTFVKGGQVAAESARPLVAAVGEKFAAGPGLQVASAATGSGAAGVVREEGGGAGAQMAAGIAGALVPGGAPYAARSAVRGMMRGGEAGRVRAEENLNLFRAAGTEPTLAQATEGRVARAAESYLAKAPGGAGVIAKKAQQQADEMAARVEEITSKLSSDATAAGAGESIMKAMQGFKAGFKSIQERLYNKLDQHIPENTPIGVGNTEFALKQLNADIPGAPNLSEWFKNARIKGIDKALYADLEQATAAGTLPYQAIKKLRTLVGNEIADSSFVSDVPRGKWSALYGALSDDLGEAAKKAGPQAEQSWQWANQFTKTQLARMEELSTVLSKDAPERVFQSALSGTAQGDTIVRRVVSAMPKSERRNFAGAVLQRLGRATPGQQDATGEAFSSETFLTNLSKLSPAARQTIFGRTDDDGLVKWVQQLAKVAESRREGGRVFANPSGSASSVAQLAVGSGIVAGLATGNPVPLVAAAGTAAGANMAARAVTSPKAAEIAASRTPIMAGTQAAAVEAPTLLEPAGAASSPQAPASALPTPEQSQEQLPARVSLPAAAGSNPVEQVARAQSVDEAIIAAAAAVQAPIAVDEIARAVASAPPPAAAPEPARDVQLPPAAPGGEQPVTLWLGRKGNGYVDEQDARNALPTRERMNPELRWAVERMPDGMYRLAGYEQREQ